MLSDRDLLPMRPSALSIVINCGGSRRLSMQAPEKESSSYADEGTAAHSLAEQCLRTGRAPFEFRGQIIMVNGTPYKVNKDMIIATGHYVGHLWAKLRAKARKVPHLLEQKVFIPEIDNGGTVDSVIMDTEEMVVDLDDYKHGKGVYVSEVLNSQMMGYGLGVMHSLWPRHIPIPTDLRMSATIHQPRFPETKPFRTYYFTYGDLMTWKNETLLPAIARSRLPDAPLNAGAHCQFCRAKPICGAYLTSDRPKYQAVPVHAPAVPSGFQF